MWQSPYQRIAYWNKFGKPEGYLTRFGDYRDVPGLWSIDPQLAASVAKGMGDTSAKMPVGAVDVHYWDEYAKQHPVSESEGFSGSK